MTEILPLAISQLSETDALNRLEVNKGILNSVAPGIELEYGFVHDVVLRLQSILGESQAAAMKNMSDLINPVTAGQSVYVTSSIVDTTAAAFGLSRFEAVPAVGTVTFVVSAARTTVVPAGTILSTVDGDLIYVQNTYVAQPANTELRGQYDRRLTLNADNQYEFTVPAVTLATGSLIRINSGEPLTLQSDAIPLLVGARTSSIFSGGQDEETDAQLVSRIRSVFPASTLSSRGSIGSFLRRPGLLPSLQAVSSIGFGDPELNRGGGLRSTADIYVRTRSLPIQKTLILEASVSGEEPGVEATWTATIGRDAAPGFYRVVSASIDGAGVVKSIEMVRGYDTSEIITEQIPYIAAADDAAFSRFQTAHLTVVTSNNDFSLNDTADMTVVVEYMPELQTLQEAVGSREFRFIGGDALVRAPVPVYLSVSIDIVADVDAIAFDIAAVRSSVANLFSSRGFASTIYSSQVSTLVNDQLPSGATVRDVSGLSEAIYPDGTIIKKRHSSTFEIDNEPDKGVSSRTAAWLLSSNKVAINVNNNSQPFTV